MKAVTPYTEQRPEITVSEQFMADILPMIRRQFMPEADDRFWNTHKWLVQRAVTYPAAWLNERAVFVTTERYREILLNLIQDIKVHMGAVKMAPAYLLACVQRHFRFNAEQYNSEGKAARDVVARAVGQLRPAEAQPDELVKTLAAAHALIKPPRRQRKAAPVAQKEFAL